MLSENGGNGKTNSVAALSRTRSNVYIEPSFKKRDRSPLEESSVHTDHAVLCCCGPQRPHGCSLKFSSIQQIGLSPLSLLGNYSRSLEQLLRPDPKKKPLRDSAFRKFNYLQNLWSLTPNLNSIAGHRLLKEMKCPCSLNNAFFNRSFD